jgi:hypothetical protein
VKLFEHFLHFAFIVVVGSGQLSAQTSKPNVQDTDDLQGFSAKAETCKFYD